MVFTPQTEEKPSGAAVQARREATGGGVDAPPSHPGPPPAPIEDRERHHGLVFAEIAVAVLGFAALCVLVLTKASQFLEPDDYAYQASIVALSHGHLTLTTAQYDALSRSLGDGGRSIIQWTHLANGNWISEKNPGYPFFAVIFSMLGIFRLAPLFYGGLACIGLFFGARKWLGRYGGTFAVLLFCTSGAAITFAWRATMPSFTDASLVAAGAGALLWAMLAADASQRRRLVVGLAAFVAFAGATFIRYTDVVEILVAAAAVVVFAKRAGLTWRTVASWLSVVAIAGAGILTFNGLIYGSPLSTGYSAGEITFSLSAIVPNFEQLPGSLLVAMPMAVLALVAAGWIGIHRFRHGGVTNTTTPAVFDGRQQRHHDALVAGVLAGGWAAIWLLYSAYTWTVGQVSASSVHVVRFYLPALGLIALLGAWTLVRMPRVVSAPAVIAIAVAGVLSFQSLASAGPPGFGGPGGGPGVYGFRPPAGGAPGVPGGGPPGLPGVNGGSPGGFLPPASGSGSGLP